jgi:cytochrome b involved in lipid metabolism
MDFRKRREEKQKEIAAKLTQLEWKGDIKMEEVRQHNSPTDMWVVFDGNVYDITEYIQYHPGGAMCFTNPSADKDITKSYNAVHRHVPISMISKLKIGHLVK